MDWIHLLTGAIVGGIIGYFTNYIAVKMLFRPRREIRVFGRVLPFTPGVIPKRRGDLARAVGNAVSETLIGRDELTEMLISERMQNAFADGVSSALDELVRDRSVEDALSAIVGEETVGAAREEILNRLRGRIADYVNRMDLGHAIADAAGKTVLSRLQGSMLSLFVTPEKIASFTNPLADQISDYIADEGMNQVSSFLESEADRLMNLPADRIAKYRGALRPRIQSAYAAFMRENAPKIAESFEISKIVTDKINRMDIDELEKLILSVMKKELSTVVNLGAVLGFLIGIIGALI